MSQLFAHNFTVPVVEAEGDQPEPVYDEERCLSLDASGRVFVERAVGGIHTLTEVRGEGTDPDDDAIVLLRTETKMRPSEREDSISFSAPGLGTTTKVAREADDVGEIDITLGTKTAVPREGEDWAPEAFLGTETAVGREPGDRSAELWAGTHTFIRGEAEDVAHELGEPGEVEPAVR